MFRVVTIMLRAGVLTVFMSVLAIVPVPAAARPLGDVEGASPDPFRDTICTYIEAAAGAHDLPVSYLTRLIWRESSFRPNVVSPRGAQGIAQFMPATAAERGLDDPFEPRAAIHAAASFLSDLATEFGNLGLAAAAYNGGPNRVAGWLAGSGGLPFETQSFVRIITGRTPFDWRGPAGEAAAAPPAVPDRITKPATCGAVVASLGAPARFRPTPGPAPTAPWGAQVAGHFSKDRALAIYASLQDHHDVLAGQAPMIVGGRNRSRGSALFYHVRVPARTRDEADAMCARLRTAGAACVVQKS